MHNGCMRTTITLDDEIHEFATYYARSRGISLSAAINELIRKAETRHRRLFPSSSIPILVSLCCLGQGGRSLAKW